MISWFDTWLLILTLQLVFEFWIPFTTIQFFGKEEINSFEHRIAMSNKKKKGKDISFFSFYWDERWQWWIMKCKRVDEFEPNTSFYMFRTFYENVSFNFVSFLKNIIDLCGHVVLKVNILLFIHTYFYCWFRWFVYLVS